MIFWLLNVVNVLRVTIVQYLIVAIVEHNVLFDLCLRNKCLRIDSFVHFTRWTGMCVNF